ncbi:MAG: TIGR01440 family protein [Eubacteriales bacterium]|nr:TIGR01440 family protein [Eubacteriales bacterium]
MEKEFLEQIRRELTQAVAALGQAGHCKRGGIFIFGCSTSEIAGSRIGSDSSQEIGNTVIDTLLESLSPYGMTLAVGCCEHLNRSVALPRSVAEAKGFEIVTVRPALHAGGACGVAYFAHMGEEACMVEQVQADVGIDVGHTMIGMHLKHVAVPFRCEVKSIGKAPLVLAFTRPKYVGGPRAQYE